jgi:V/A-type H+/Na+-transporting ATPase subunit A
LYQPGLEGWYRQNVAADYPEVLKELITLLQREASLQQVVQLVGPDALQDSERLALEIGRIGREDFLQQNGFDKVDAYCSMSKAYGIMQMVLSAYKQGEIALTKGGTTNDFLSDPAIEKIGRARYVPEGEFAKYKAEYDTMIEGAFLSSVKA